MLSGRGQHCARGAFHDQRALGVPNAAHHCVHIRNQSGNIVGVRGIALDRGQARTGLQPGWITHRGAYLMAGSERSFQEVTTNTAGGPQKRNVQGRVICHVLIPPQSLGSSSSRAALARREIQRMR